MHINLKLLTIIYLLFFFLMPSQAQEANLHQTFDTLTFTGTVEVKNTPQSILYTRGLTWFKNVYKNADDIIVKQSKADGYIEGNALITYEPEDFSGSELVRGTIQYKMILRFKDNAYTYIMTNFVHTPVGGSHTAIPFGIITENTLYHEEIKGTSQKWRNYVWNDIRLHAKKRMKLIIDHLDENMQKSFTRQTIKTK